MYDIWDWFIQDTFILIDLETERGYKSKYMYIHGIIDEYKDVMHVQKCPNNWHFIQTN